MKTKFWIWNIYHGDEYDRTEVLSHSTEEEALAMLIQRGEKPDTLTVYPSTNRWKCVFCQNELLEEHPACCGEFGHIEPILAYELEHYDS